MRNVRNVVVAISIAASPFVSAQAPAGDQAAAVLAATREALGGEKKLAAVKSLVATGRTRQVRGENLIPIEFEIAVEFPDRYVRKDEFPAQDNGPASTGFNGAELIQVPAPTPPPARAGGPPPPTPEQMEAQRRMRVVGVKQDWLRLALGMSAGAFNGAPLTFSYVGKAEAPQGKADVVAVTGPDNFSARLFVNADTHLPIMIAWQAPGPPQRGAGRGGPPPGAAAAGGREGGSTTPQRGAPPSREGGAGQAASPPVSPERGAAPPSASPERAAAPPREGGREGGPGGGGRGPGGPPPESRLYFSDYRDAGGFQFPFRLRRAVGPDTIEETTFDGFKINPKIDAKKFDIRK